MMFQCIIIRNSSGLACGIEFRGVRAFDWDHSRDEATIWFEDEGGMDWERVKKEVLAQAKDDDLREAAETADDLTPSQKMARIWEEK
jgi:hypothetical protein